MRRSIGWVLIGLAIVTAGGVQGQALKVDGGSSAAAAEFRSVATSGGPSGEGEAVRVEILHGEEKNSVAVVGISTPSPDFGWGGNFSGGYVGVGGYTAVAGAGHRLGVWGQAIGGASNHGVQGSATANQEAGTLAYGVFGQTSCNPGTNCDMYAVYASGDLAYTGALKNLSDLRFKESLAPLERAVEKLLELEVVTYEHIQAEEIAHMNLPRGPQVGFIAQQVAEVLPDLVTAAVHPPLRNRRDKSLKAEAIRYQALKPLDLLPYLVRAIQEQQAEIEALKAELRPWRTRLSESRPEEETEAAQVPAAF